MAFIQFKMHGGGPIVVNTNHITHAVPVVDQGVERVVLYFNLVLGDVKGRTQKAIAVEGAFDAFTRAVDTAHRAPQ